MALRLKNCKIYYIWFLAFISILDECSSAVSIRLLKFQEEVGSLSIPESCKSLEELTIRVSTFFDDLQHQIEDCIVRSPTRPSINELADVNILMSANGELYAFKLKLRVLQKRLVRVRKDGYPAVYAYFLWLGAALMMIHKTSQGPIDFFRRFDQSAKLLADEILKFSNKLVKNL